MGRPVVILNINRGASKRELYLYVRVLYALVCLLCMLVYTSFGN